MKRLHALKELVKFEREYDVVNFDQALLEVIEEKNEDDIEFLISLFYDDCSYFEVMYGIIHAIETYPRDAYVNAVLKCINMDNIEKSCFWFDIICNRIFNSPLYRDFFVDNIHRANKEALFRLLDFMEKESPHHIPLIQELRSKL